MEDRAINEHAYRDYDYKSKDTAIILLVLGFLGLAGMHRFYLGRPVTGLIWLFTGGLFLIGTLYDVFAIDRLVREANARGNYY